MQMCHDVMAVPLLSALVICQLKHSTTHRDSHGNRLPMSHIRNADQITLTLMHSLFVNVYITLIVDGFRPAVYTIHSSPFLCINLMN